ncbi:prostaglandin E2 receptor EP4 subtype-like [Aphis craccivora]|uniref:Prostaglandin E2 receptor EP4 subtype-like n=1 Tax=Aphis craccivora TaxID=307492 RepID=A0A6G0YLD6_APHCR|nr:prostaglandin E2 receptor EP4 subtype-like [Aphis craccivora]
MELPAIAFPSPTFYEVIVYFGLAVLGIFGNLLELFILHWARSSSNQKHVFMLRCMSINDLIVLVGMMSQLFVSIRWPNTQKSVWSCRIRVLWRFFEMCSGCVAVVMAVERWVAITKPFFFYEKVRIHGPIVSVLARFYNVRSVYVIWG